MPFWRKKISQIFWSAALKVLRIKKNIPDKDSSRDRHAVKKAVSPVPAKKNVYSRRFLYLGGICLAAIVALLLVVLPRVGLLPVPEIPGLDKQWTGLPDDEPAGEFAQDDNSSPSCTGTETESGTITCPESPPESFPESAEEEIPLLSGEPSSGEDVDNNAGTSSPDTGEDSAGAGDYFPVSPPALPLPSWYLHTAYGDYTSEVLPSGGLMHHRTRGVFLAGTPGASVSALWDGIVVIAGKKSFPYGNFVVLEHEGGYSTLYGNLREIWVKEGEEVSRGENIGLLPHTPAARVNELSKNGVSAEINSPDREAVSSSGKTTEVSFHTVAGGFKGDAKEKSEDKAADPEKNEGDFSSASGHQSDERAEEDNEKTNSSFHRGNPLLYLELRRDNRYLDPLLFIEERN